MIKRFKDIFTAQIFNFSISAAAIALFSVFMDSPVRYLFSAIFWLGLIFGIIFATAFGRIRRFPHRKPLRGFNTRPIKKNLPGVISFGNGGIQLTVYTVFTVGIVLIITDLIFSYISVNVMFVVIALTYFSFAIHCIIDGESFKIYKQLKEGNKYVKNR